MASDVTMPRLSDSMEEGTILKWLVDEGGAVKRGEPLVEIETDKANMTYESDTDGVLVEVVAKEGDTLAIGEVIARIGEAGEAKSGGEERKEEPEAEAEEDPEPEPEEKRTATATKERPKPSSTNGAGDGGRVKASPVARRMAEELGVELARLEGSGPGGRIVKADVEAAAGDGGAKPATAEPEAEPAEAPQPARGEAGAKGEVEVHDLTRLQQTVTRRMAESKATAPDFALTLDVDMTGAVALRERLKEVAEQAPSFNDMVVKAAASALTEHPKVNGAYRDGRFELYGNVNVGVAVAAQDALVVPTIFGADQKSLGAIAREARRLIERVREKQITPPELSGGTFTVSNLGMFGIERFTAIINPPQAAILTVGALAKRPAVDDRGRVVARDQMTLTLVCDHRILYGADGAQFLARVKELLEQPLSLAL
ncbi:MAG: 2-oxo acid dehydrogenase subunit E2 [Thermoleophilaceae bacterium]|nr:2-oxo acid dehydrogenase subunit E2 [Thermoleophilaceae bacterium]